MTTEWTIVYSTFVIIAIYPLYKVIEFFERVQIMGSRDRPKLTIEDLRKLKTNNLIPRDKRSFLTRGWKNNGRT